MIKSLLCRKNGTTALGIVWKNVPTETKVTEVRRWSASICTAVNPLTPRWAKYAIANADTIATTITNAGPGFGRDLLPSVPLGAADARAQIEFGTC